MLTGRTHLHDAADVLLVLVHHRVVFLLSDAGVVESAQALRQVLQVPGKQTYACIISHGLYHTSTLSFDDEQEGKLPCMRARLVGKNHPTEEGHAHCGFWTATCYLFSLRSMLQEGASQEAAGAVNCGTFWADAPTVNPRKATCAPRVLLDLLDGDAPLGVDGQDAREQVLALWRDGHAGGQLVVAAGHPLHHLCAHGPFIILIILTQGNNPVPEKD